MLRSLVVVLMAATGCWSSARPAPTPAPAPTPEPVTRATPPTRDLVQPVKIEKQQPVAGDDGVEGGVEGGVIGGVDGPPPPPPPPPPKQERIPAQALEANRVAGENQIAPDAKTKASMAKAGKDRVVASFKLCLGADGALVTVDLLKSSGFPGYDHTLESTIRGTWRFRPYLINGHEVPVCTAVTLTYSS